MNSKTTLARLRPGDRAVIADLPVGRHLAKLLALGLLPGQQLEVLQTVPLPVVAVDHTSLALDRQLAAIITVLPVRGRR